MVWTQIEYIKYQFKTYAIKNFKLYSLTVENVAQIIVLCSCSFFTFLNCCKVKLCSVHLNDIPLSKWWYWMWNIWIHFSYITSGYFLPSYPKSLTPPLQTSLSWTSAPPPSRWPGLHQRKPMGWSYITRSCMRMNPIQHWWTHPPTESLWPTWSHSPITMCLWGLTLVTAMATKHQTRYTCCLERTVR